MPDITEKDILAWLDMQRDAVNTEIVFAAPDEKKQYHKNLQIINAIEARMQEMTAVEYLKVQRDMFVQNEPKAITSTLEQMYNPVHAVGIVKKWKEERDGH